MAQESTQVLEPGVTTEAARHSDLSPQGLLKIFTLLSVFSAIAILVLSGIGIHRIYSKELIHVAEGMAAYVGESIFEQERGSLLKSNDLGYSIRIADGDLDAFDDRMKRFLKSFSMHKIKVFDATREIVYSTDAKIAGAFEKDNDRLAHVLATGRLISKLEHKDKVRSLTGDERSDVDIVEAYVPIRIGNEIIGAFEVYVDVTSTRQRVVKAVRESMIVIGAILVLVFVLLYLPMRRGTMRLKRAEERLQELASTDTLTGIFNRRYLFSRIEQEYARLKRLHQAPNVGSTTFMMIDIDLFKKLNDTYGHLAGDHVLREVSQRIKNSLRIYDVLGRYGGEEFLVMLPHTCTNNGQMIAERLLDAIRGTPIDAKGVSVTVTVSIGIAAAMAGEDMTMAINRADQCLYHAKRSGRNRVCTEPEPPATHAEPPPMGDLAVSGAAA